MYTIKEIPSEAQIRKFLRRTVFGINVYCPACHSRKVIAEATRYWCRPCRTRFSLLSHTWLANMKLPLKQFWMLLWCWTTQIPVRQTMSLTKLSEVSVRHWFDQFRAQLPIEHGVLEKLVQLDEAYFGGKKGKTLLMGKQIGSRKLAFQVLPHTNPVREEAWWFLQTFVEPGSDLHTDGGAIYHGIDQHWPIQHKVDLHKKFEFELTSEIEGMFGVLRTFIRRMYHHVSSDKLEELVCEFAFRFSHKEMFENPRYFLQFSLRLRQLV